MSYRRLFVSCVSGEFAGYRDKLLRSLTSHSTEVHIQEHFRTSGVSLLEKLDVYIERCDAIIHLIGDGVGQLARQDEAERIFASNVGMRALLQAACRLPDGAPLPDFSYTQWEAYLAIFHKRQCFNFIADADSARESGWVSKDVDRASQSAHVERLRTLGRDRKTLTLRDPEKVANEILQAMVADLDARVATLSGSVSVGVGRPESKIARNFTAGSGASFLDVEGAPALTLLPAGTDFIGSPESEAGRWSDGRENGRTVTFSLPFAVSTAPVSVAEFALFAQEKNHVAEGAYVLREGAWMFEQRANWRDVAANDLESVTCVNWYDANAYVRWLSSRTGRLYRLLTESEWEYAARAGSDAAFPFAEAEVDSAVVAAGAAVIPVGPYDAQVLAPNAWALRAMNGNVWEWCVDTWRHDHRSAPLSGHDPYLSGDPTRRVVRGGSWYDDPRFARSASRDHMPADFRASNLGFRVARAL
jgi:formylglycine-generating enzyme required for sulfatase activity